MFIFTLGIPDLVNALVCFLCFFKLYSTWKEQDAPSQRLLYLIKTYFFLALAYLIFSWPLFLQPFNPYFLGGVFIIGHTCLFIGLSYYLAVPLSFRFPQKTKMIFRIALLASFLALVAIITRFIFGDLDFIALLYEQHIEPVLASIIMLFFIIVLVPAMIFFFRTGFKTDKREVQLRSYFMAAGTMIYIGSQILYYVFNYDNKFIIAHVFSFIALVIILVGFYYKERDPKNPLSNIQETEVESPKYLED